MSYSSDSRGKKEKNQHIQVFVRVRPPNASEKTGRSSTVVEVPTNKDVVIKERPQDKHTKKFTFDQVFGANSKQIDVYDAVVKPLVAEVLAGYNCTVFAYGQTGTGKTFTMEGLNNDPAIHWQSDTQAGIIPRTLSHLFDELRVNDAQEYTVRVSFLELYNEELFDLLTPSDDASKIRLYEDASKKGSVIIHGLEEVTVHNKSEVYKILEKGSEKRQTAATLMNAHSSRSHTVFSITVHIKENTVEGEELLKTGKINLVDLAGSENVGRSGAVDRRAREAGNINQSLLTLGRVITALVERAPHIPYRESKLTRILQESLGGRTKTSIIATVSPASVNIEETLSTLDYAHRAKNITNRPEINQKMSKKALLKEYTEEIERLRRDLSATRERNGVYLAQENYNEMQAQIAFQGKEIEEKINHIKALEEAMSSTKKIFNDLQEAFENEKRVLRKTEEKLEEKKVKLKTTRTMLEETMLDREVQKHLVEKHQTTEERLLTQAQTLVTVADTATADVAKLHDKISRKKHIEAENVKIEKQFQNDISEQIQHIEEDMSQHIQNTIQFCLAQKNVLDSQTMEQCQNIDKTITHVSEQLPSTISNMTSEYIQSVDTSHAGNNEWLKRELQKTNNFSEQQTSSLTTFFPNLAQEIRKIVDNKLSENLQYIQANLTEKLSKLAQKSQESVKMICDKFNENHNVLLTELMAMEKLNKENFDLEKERSKERLAIVEEFDDVYNKMRDLMENQFAKSMKRAKMYNKEDSEKPVTDHLQSIGQFCYTMKDKSTQGLTDGTKFAYEKEEESQKVLKRIKLDAESALRENWTLADTTRNSCNNLVNKMETEVEEYVKNIGSYQTERQASGKELREQLERQKDASTSFAKDVKSTVSSAGSEHKEFMETQKSDMMAACNGNKRKWDSECTNMNEWRTKMSTQLHLTKQQVDKFLKEDLRRDQATGTTPVRRDFAYPKILASTSPHERIIQKFKESQLGPKKILGFEESFEEETDVENSQSSVTSQELTLTSIKENKTSQNSTPEIQKRSSSTRFSPTLENEKNTQEIELPTEIMVNNKENEDEVPMIKKPMKRSERLSQLTRKVLGSSN